MRSWFLLGSFQQAAVSSRWQTIQFVLTPLVVVVMDELFHSSRQFLVGFKLVEIVHFAFQDAPKSLPLGRCRYICRPATYFAPSSVCPVSL